MHANIERSPQPGYKIESPETCTCCLSNGNLINMQSYFDVDGIVDSYIGAINSCFNIKILDSCEAQYYICDVCLPRLTDSYLFKSQIIKARATLLGKMCEYSSKNDPDFDHDYTDALSPSKSDDPSKMELNWVPVQCEMDDNISESVDQPAKKVTMLPAQHDPLSTNSTKPHIIVKRSRNEKLPRKGRRMPMPGKIFGALQDKKKRTASKAPRGRKKVGKHKTRSSSLKPLGAYHLPTDQEIKDEDLTSDDLPLIPSSLFAALNELESKKPFSLPTRTDSDDALSYLEALPTNDDWKKDILGEMKMPLIPSRLFAALKECDQKKPEERPPRLRSKQKPPHEPVKDEMRAAMDLDSLSCKLCQMRFYTSLTLRKHMSTHFVNYTCEQCGKGFPTRNGLMIHTKLHEVGKFKCQFCSRKFQKATTIHRHEARHISGDLISCSICGEYLRSEYRRQKHMRDVHNDHRYKCEKCGYVGVKLGELKKHNKMYHAPRVRAYVCEVCEKDFFTTHALRYHMVTHSDDKPFACDNCGKRFSTMKLIRKHMTTHASDRKMYDCMQCDRKFVSRRSLKYHLKSKHAIDIGCGLRRPALISTCAGVL